jgi:hypothetical protein
MYPAWSLGTTYLAGRRLPAVSEAAQGKPGNHDEQAEARAR